MRGHLDLSVRAVAVVAILVACGKGADAGFFPPSIGACPPSRGHADRPSAVGFFTQPGVWYRVESIDLMTSSDPSLQTTVFFAGRYSVVRGDPSATASVPEIVDSLRMHGTIAQEISQTKELGAEVFAHSSSLGHTTVAYAVAFSPDEFVFLGRCALEFLTEPMQRLFGAEATRVLRDLVGQSSTKMKLAFKQESPPAEVTVLAPGIASDETLQGLQLATIALTRVPDHWVGDYTICSHIRRGWNDCVPLRDPVLATTAVTMFFDPEEPLVEVWLIDSNDDLRDQTVRLATADLAALAAKAGLDLAKDGVRLDIRLSDSVSASEAVESPSLAAKAIDALDLTEVF